MDFFQLFLELAQSTVRLSTPLILAALAGLFTERAGVFDIGLEGKMLGGAFAAGTVAFVAQSAMAGLMAAVVVSVLLSLVHGYASITQRGNQIVSGVAINFIVAGSTVILGEAWFKQGGRTPALAEAARFQEIDLPFAEALRGVPLIGPIYADLISGHAALTYFAFLMVPVTWWILYRTRFGLRLRLPLPFGSAFDSGIGAEKVCQLVEQRNVRHRPGIPVGPPQRGVRARRTQPLR